MFTAFLYDDYYCTGIADSFSGVYNSEDKVLETLRGGRFNSQNLEILDLDTLGIKHYRWLPLYQIREDNQVPCSHIFLKHRWDEKQKEFEIFWEGNARKYNKHQIYYDAGEWIRDLAR